MPTSTKQPWPTTTTTDRDTRGTIDIVPGRGSIAGARIPARNFWTSAPSFGVLTDVYDLVDELTSWVGRERVRGIVMPDETLFRYVVSEMLRDTPSIRQ